MAMVKVKICGNRTVEDVEVSVGADAQGFIVETPQSPRNLEVEEAQELMAYVPPFTAAVLVTTATDPLWLAELVEALEPNALQVHVELSSVQIDRIRRALPGRLPIYCLLSVYGTAEECLERARRLADSPLDALLLDSTHQGQSGGTGQVHDWQISALVREELDPFPVILAGGLTPENVEEAIRTVRPYAIDVSSGVESHHQKDPLKVQALLEAVRRCG